MRVTELSSFLCSTSYTEQAIAEIQQDSQDVHSASPSQRMDKPPPFQCHLPGEEVFLALPGCSSQQVLAACAQGAG